MAARKTISGKLAGVFVAALAISACATRYSLPAGAAGTASLTIERANRSAGFGSGSNQFFLVTPDSCANRATLTAFGPLDGDRKVKAIEAGRRLRFTAITQYYSGFATGMTTSRCENEVFFTPRRGESYTLRQPTTINTTCTVEVIEASSGRPPSDLEHVEPMVCND